MDSDYERRRDIVPLANDTDNEESGLMDDQLPKRELEELSKDLKEFWSGKFDKDVVKNISSNLRSIEARVCKKYDRCSPSVKKEMDIGDLKETLDAMEELSGW